MNNKREDIKLVSQNTTKIGFGYVFFFLALLLSALAFMLLVVVAISFTNFSSLDAWLKAGSGFMLVSLLIVTALVVALFIIAQKWRHPIASKYHPSQPQLSLGHAWLQRGSDTLIECNDVIFSTNDNSIVYHQDAEFIRVPFDTIAKVKSVHDLYQPTIKFVLADGKVDSLHFVASPESIKKLTGSKVFASRVLLGEAATLAIAGKDGATSSYKQLGRDTIAIIEAWLKFHRVKAYKGLFNRNVRTFVGVFFGAGILIAVLIYILSNL